MPGVDQQHLHRALGLTQGMKDRLPVDPRRFHRHVRHAFRHQPGHHLGQRLVKGVVLAHLLAALPRSLTRGAHRHRDDLLADIDRGHPLVHDLHVGSLPRTIRTTRHPQSPHEYQESETRARYGGNPDYPTGAGSSVNLWSGLNPRQGETTSAGDAPPVSATRERRARGIKSLVPTRRDTRAAGDPYF
jgi:hypothetical protein